MDSVVTAFPHTQAIVKTLTLPAADLEEIRSMVKLYAARHIPLPEEEIVVEGCFLERRTDGPSTILMIVVRKEDVRRHVEMIAQAGCAPDKVVLDSMMTPEKEVKTLFSTINLLPEEDRNQRFRLRLKKDLIKTGSFFLAFGLSMVVMFGLRRHEKRKYLQALTRTEKDLSAKTKEWRAMQQEIRMMQRQTSRNGSFLHLLADVQARIPKTVSIESLSFEKGQSLDVEGACLQMPDILRMVEALQKSPLFPKVELVSSGRRSIGGRDLVDFHVSCRLGAGKSPRMEEPSPLMAARGNPMDRDIARKEQAILIDREILRTQETIRRDYRLLQARAKGIPESGTTGLLKELEALTQKSGVKLEHIAPQSRAGDPSANAPVSMVIESPWTSLARFVYQVYESPLILDIESAHLRLKSDKDTSIEGEFTLVS